MKMASQSDQDWQSTKKTVLERSIHMFNNPHMSDIKFSCGQSTKTFNAHKYVLATSSSVFNTMFYGSLPETNSVIHLPDTDEETLEAFLYYLYTDTYPETPEIALKLLYLASKYMIASLTEKCIKIVQETITAERAFLILEKAVQFRVPILAEKCWEVINSETREAIASKHFPDITHDVLLDLLPRHALQISEIELFLAVWRWTDHQCSKAGLETTSENRRRFAGDTVHHIRFLSISQEDFSNMIVPTGLLTNDEMVAVFEKFSLLQPASLARRRSYFIRFSRFSSEHIKRPSSALTYLSGLLLQRFRDNPDPTFSWDYSRGEPEILLFSVNQDILFHGVRLFGDLSGSRYTVTLTFGDAEVTDTCRSEYASFDGQDSYGFDVLLPKPVHVVHSGRSRDYREIVVFIKGPRSCYGMNGSRFVENHPLEMSFASHPTSHWNGTNCDCGQICQVFVSPYS